MQQAEEKQVPMVALVDAEPAMHKGRAGSLVMLGALALALLGGLVFLVGGDDQARVYGEIGKQINGQKHASFDQFWGCALAGDNVADIKSNAELITLLAGRAETRGRSYGVYVREKCMPRLERLGPGLESLIVPDDLKAEVAALRQANEQLRSGMSSYVTYLDDPDLVYDPEKVEPQLQQISHAWYDFIAAHAAINKTIRAKLK